MDFQFHALISQLVMGGMNSIALLENNDVFSWGEKYITSARGGYSGTVPEKEVWRFTIPVKQMISTGARRMALLENDDLFLWGWNLSSIRDESRRQVIDTPTPLCFDFVEMPLLEQTYTTVYNAYHTQTISPEAPSADAKDSPAAAASEAAPRFSLRHSW